MKIVVIVAAVVAVVFVIAFLAFLGSNEENQASKAKRKTLESYLKNIPGMTTEELNKMHDALFPYAIEGSMSALADLFAPNPSDPDQARSTEEKQRRAPLPNGEIYGCRTYGDAEALNAAIVKELDRRYNRT